MTANAQPDRLGAVITVAQVKNRPAEFLMERLRRAQGVGMLRLTVLNRGRPVLYLGLAENMPEAWAAADSPTVPLSDLKRSQVSLTGIRKERRALLLSQRGGPTLALWPLEDDPAARVNEDSGLIAVEVRQLRRKLGTLERRVDALVDALKLIAEYQTRLFSPDGEAASGKRKD